MCMYLMDSYFCVIHRTSWSSFPAKEREIDYLDAKTRILTYIVHTGNIKMQEGEREGERRGREREREREKRERERERERMGE